MDRWDVVTALGIVLLGLGLALLAPWLGITVAGAVLLVLGAGGAWLTARGTTGGPAADREVR